MSYPYNKRTRDLINLITSLLLCLLSFSFSSFTLYLFIYPVEFLACIQDGTRRISERGDQLELHWIYRQPRCFGSNWKGSTLFSSWSVLLKISCMLFLTYTVDSTINLLMRQMKQHMQLYQNVLVYKEMIDLVMWLRSSNWFA